MDSTLPQLEGLTGTLIGPLMDSRGFGTADAVTQLWRAFHEREVERQESPPNIGASTQTIKAEVRRGA